MNYTESVMVDVPPDSLDNRRNAARAPVSIEADLRKTGRTPFKICLRDLSQTGCRADTLTKTYVGDRIWLTLPSFAPIEGVIRWVTPHGFGCQWAAPIHASVFDHIRIRFPDLMA
jgi:PilZ domain